MYAFAEARLAEVGFANASGYAAEHSRTAAQPEFVDKYPLLARAGWLLPTVTTDGAPAEDLDLASRSAMPKSLADAILQTHCKGPLVLRVDDAVIDACNGNYCAVGLTNGHVRYLNDEGALIEVFGGQWVLTSACGDEVVQYRVPRLDSHPPFGTWLDSNGFGTCVIMKGSSVSKAPVPWRDRTATSKLVKPGACVRRARLSILHSLLVGVSLHLIVLRKRYLLALSTWARVWAKNHASTVPHPRSKSALVPRRQCAGVACSRARAAGLPGGFTVGSLTRCTSCRTVAKCRDAAACLQHVLARRGSAMRSILLFKAEQLSSVSTIIARSPV